MYCPWEIIQTTHSTPSTAISCAWHSSTVAVNTKCVTRDHVRTVVCVCLCRFRLILCPGSSRSHTWTTATLLSLPKYVNTVRATYTLHTHYSHATTSSTATHEKEARMNYPCFKYLRATLHVSAQTSFIASYVHRPSPQPRTPPSPYTAICCMQTHAYHPSSYANLYEHTFSNRVTWVGLCPLKYRVLSPPNAQGMEWY